MKGMPGIFRIILLMIAGLTIAASQITAADNVFQTKCSKCHALPLPGNFTKAEWKYHVDRMAKRAGLTPQEIKEIAGLNKK